MFSKNAKTVVDKALKHLYKLQRYGRYRNNTVEKIDASFDLNPNEEYLDFGKTRPANREYIKNELAWYISQDKCIRGHKGIENNTIWQRCATKSGYVNSNYGWCVFSPENGAQYAHAVLHLIDNDMSRQSVIIYNRPSMHTECNNGIDAEHDFTCTMYTQHFITNDNSLAYIVNMRSNDAIFGLQNDYSWHRYVYFQMLEDLRKTYPELKVGKIIWHAGSLHVYSRHFELLQNIMEEYENG